MSKSLIQHRWREKNFISVLKTTIGMVFSITFAPKAYENIIIFPVNITDIS